MHSTQIRVDVLNMNIDVHTNPSQSGSCPLSHSGRNSANEGASLDDVVAFALCCQPRTRDPSTSTPRESNMLDRSKVALRPLVLARERTSRLGTDLIYMTSLRFIALHSRGRICVPTGRCPREGSTAVAFPPPLSLAKAFSRSGCGRIFPLFSGVMRVGLSTVPTASRHRSGLSGSIFSGPHDCHVPV